MKQVTTIATEPDEKPERVTINRSIAKNKQDKEMEKKSKPSDESGKVKVEEEIVKDLSTSDELPMAKKEKGKLAENKDDINSSGTLTGSIGTLATGTGGTVGSGSSVLTGATSAKAGGNSTVATTVGSSVGNSFFKGNKSSTSINETGENSGTLVKPERKKTSQKKESAEEIAKLSLEQEKPSNMIVVETETVDSSPKVILSGYTEIDKNDPERLKEKPEESQGVQDQVKRAKTDEELRQDKPTSKLSKVPVKMSQDLSENFNKDSAEKFNDIIQEDADVDVVESEPGHKSLNSSMSHASYSRSLRNKRSILLDSNNSNPSSATILPPISNSTVASNSNDKKGTTSAKANPSVPNNKTVNKVHSNYKDDDEKSVTSSIKKRKNKPRLNKIASSRADIFEAQVEGALEDNQHSDGNETFVYDSRGHSRDNSTNTIELEMAQDEVAQNSGPNPDQSPAIGTKELQRKIATVKPPINEVDKHQELPKVKPYRSHKKSRLVKSNFPEVKLEPKDDDYQSEFYYNDFNGFNDKDSLFNRQSNVDPASSIASTSVKDLDLDSNSAFMSEKNFVDDQNSVNNFYYKRRNNGHIQRYEKTNDAFNNILSSHENTSDSELEYTTDDLPYPKFTRYRKSLSNYHNDPNTSAGTTNATEPKSQVLKTPNSKLIRKFPSRSSSITDKAKNATDNDIYGLGKGNINPRSPNVNYHSNKYRRFSKRVETPNQQYAGHEESSPTKTIVAPGSVRSNHQYGSYNTTPMPNQLRTTISKLFDPQGTNLKRYSGVQDDINIEDIDDENFDNEDANYFHYDLEDGSEINETTPLNLENHTNYNRKLRNMSSIDEAKMNAYRNSRLLNSNGIGVKHYPGGGYYRNQARSNWQLVQSTFWVILLMISFLTLGFVCGFFLASTKDLADVTITQVNHMLVSVDELIFDIHCEGLNPGFTSIIVSDIDLDLFVKTRYLDEGDDYERLFNYETFFIGNIRELEYPLTFPSNLLDRKKVQASSEIKLIDPGKNSSDPTYRDDSISETGLMANKETDPQKNWKIAIKYPFELIVRGKFKYTLPFSSGARAIAVHKSVSVDPGLDEGFSYGNQGR